MGEDTCTFFETTCGTVRNGSLNLASSVRILDVEWLGKAIVERLNGF